jgi:molybdopterin converting factor small subunit
MDTLASRPGNADVLALVQLLGDAIKPVRDDVKALGDKLDTLARDFEQRYYSRDVIDTMRVSNQEQMVQLKEELADLKAQLKDLSAKQSTDIQTIQQALSGQWERWLSRLGLPVALLLNIIQIFVLLNVINQPK